MSWSPILRRMAQEGFETSMALLAQKPERQQFAFTEALIRFLEHWTGGGPAPAARAPRPARKKAGPRARSKGPVPRWKLKGHQKPGPKPKKAEVGQSVDLEVATTEAAVEIAREASKAA